MVSYSTNDMLRITWNEGRGKAIIFLPEFFPCTKSQFNKLNKLIDTDWRNCDMLHEQVTAFFKDALIWCKQNYEIEGKSYWKNIEKRDELKHKLVDLMCSKQELNNRKKEIRSYEQLAKENARNAKKFKKDEEWFKTQLGETDEN